MITKQTFTFLKDLEKNNDREWFAKHKSTFDVHNNGMKDFMQKVRDDLDKTDVIGSHKVYRIYRDVRFSKNKLPYKSNFSGHLSREGASRRGGYFISIEPGNTFVGGGFWGPNKEDLYRIRKEFEHDATEIRKIINKKTFKDMFGELRGEELKTAPRDFDKEDPAIDLIKKKSFYVMREFSDKEVLSKDFTKEINKTFKAMRPYCDYMSEVLTTDLNGISII